MVTGERYCIDVLTQISAAGHALQEVALGLLDDHVRGCVTDAARTDPDKAEALPPLRWVPRPRHSSRRITPPGYIDGDGRFRSSTAVSDRARMEAMATVAHRGGATHGAVLRWTRAAVLTLVTVLAVLVHHETAAAVTHVPPMEAPDTSSLAGMHHSPPSAVLPPANGHIEPPSAAASAAAHDDGACSGTAWQHCSAAGVDSVKLAPPHQPSTGWAPAFHSGAATGRDVPGTTGRAPPDLSVLSRLLL